MAKLSETKLRAILAAEKADAMASVTSSTLSADRSDAMDYYLGDMTKDMPTIEGQSKAVSTDVADTVEGLMPQLIEIFAGSDDVVRFDPVAEDDVERAEQETDYVNHVFMQQNPGFIVLYSMIKDALLSKVGVCKVWWEKKTKESRETFYDQSEDVLELLLSKEGVEVVEHTAKDDPNAPPLQPGMEDQSKPQLHDITIVCKSEYECARVEPVPPEEFGISRRAKSIRDTTYCFHEPAGTTEADLIEQGFDQAQVRGLPTYDRLGDTESQSRDTVEEGATTSGDEGLNTSQRPIQVTEHYIRLDYEDDGKPALYRITTGGEVGEVLNRDGEPAVERIEFIPFAAMTPVIVTHRFFGRSIADLVMDIQRIKTALLRALLNNAYLANAPRPEISESHVTDTTLDDLLVWRPGAPIRTKAPGGLNWQKVPDISGNILPAIEYQDMTREWRTGVTRQGQGIDAESLSNQSATAVQKVYSAAQARVKLIARIFAETGIRDLFWLLHATIRKHGRKAATVKLRNKWVTVNPREWKDRNDITITVGLGSGGKQEELAGAMIIAGLQEKAMASGLTNLVNYENLYSTAKWITKIVGHKSVDSFFTDPKGLPPPQPKQDPKIMELQAKNEIEKTQD